MKSKIILKGLRFKAFHGYYAEEQRIGGDYMVDIEFNYNIVKAATTDSLENAIDYEEIYTLCKNEMANPRKLIETVGYEMASLLKDRYPAMDTLTLTIHKLAPPIAGQIDRVSIQIEIE
ncbi:dihydroneopterin aldolase [Membranihabitans maritimus]|uniref:dihydroneopterin aldolase n=1 Tax=Membranihabitans maritimus TaxID=2904244 RepID=UPI001EFFEEA0|nr:dihydroneopterin aldolase [Membranihabitans maritimus]